MNFWKFFHNQGKQMEILNIQDQNRQNLNMETKIVKVNPNVQDVIESQKKDEERSSTRDLQTQIEINRPIQKLKSTARIIAIGLIISLSALINGYGIKEITSVPIETLIREYGITLDRSAAQSILIGILPIGAILGVFITKFMLIHTRRLTGIYVFALVNVAAIVLVNVTTFEALIAGRFIEGICIGFYTTIAPIYLKEISSSQLRSTLGLLFSLGRILGILFAICLQLSLPLQQEMGRRTLLSMTAIFSILQATLMYLFGSDTPTQMLLNNRQDLAKQIISSFYKQQHAEQVLQEYKKEVQVEMMKNNKQSSQNNNQFQESMQKINRNMIALNKIENNYWQNPQSKEVKEQKEKSIFQIKKNKAFWLGVHLCIIRNWTGGNTIITQGGLFIKGLHADLGKYSSLNINLVQFLFVIVGLIWVKNHFGKRTLFLFSIPVLSALNLALSTSMYFEEVFSAKVIMCLYMAIYGGAFISPIWSYPSEIIPASEAVIPNVAHWLALATSTLIPPIVAGMMPNGNPYPVFVFFGLYGFLSFIHVFKDAKESDGKAYDEIIQSFD